MQVPQAQPSAPAAVKAFRDWAVSYFLAQPEQRVLLEPRGQLLAVEHRQAIAQMIPTDPKSAIENAVPMVVRQDLPESIVTLLEQRINQRGQLLVVGMVAATEVDAAKTKAIQRWFEPEGQAPNAPRTRYDANVYGKRQAQHTLDSARVSGVAVDGQLAVLDSTVRPLEIGERPDPTKKVFTSCPISGIETELATTPGQPLPPITKDTPAIQDNTTIRYICAGGDEHIRVYADKLSEEERQSHWASRGVAAEGGTGGALLPFNPPPGWTTGTSSLLYIRCAFPEQGNDPLSEALCYANLKQTTDYFMENSRGRFYLTSTVAPLVVLPHPESWYNASRDSGGTLNGEFVIYDQAREIAARMGYDTTNFDLDVVHYQNGPGTFGGLGSVGGKLVILRSSSVGVLMHELGHNLGLWHSNYWQTNPPSRIGPGSNNEYGNIFDVMGSSGSLGHYIAAHKAIINWLTPDQYHDVRSNGTYRIYQTDQGQADAGKRYALRVARDSERNYWLEMRQQFAQPALFGGLMLTWDSWGYNVDNTSYGSNRGAQLIDTTPGSGSVADTRDDAAIAVGRTFSDPDIDLHITPILKGATVPPYIDAVINKGPFPGNLAPTLSLIASTSTPAVGVAVNFTGAASDPNGDAVAYSWDFGDGTFSTDGLRTQAKSWSLDGKYRVLCTASDMKGKRTTRGILITVGTGGTNFTISGTITDALDAPIEGLYVANRALIAATAQPNVAAFRYAITDSNGLYTLTNVPTGNITIIPHMPPFAFSPNFPNPLTVAVDSTGRDFQAGAGPTGNILTVTIVDGVAAETGGNTATITLVRSGPTTGVLDVPFLTGSTGTAIRNTDYTMTPALYVAPAAAGGLLTFRFAAAQSTITIVLTAVNDAFAEGEEYAVIELPDAMPGFTRIGPKTITIPIADSDSTNPVVALLAAEPSSSEAGDTASMILRRDGSTPAQLAADLTVNLTYSGVAALGPDISGPTSVTIPAGSTSTTFTLIAFDDIFAEGTEFGTVSLATSSNYERDTQQRSGQFYITDNDQPVLTIVATDAAAAEAASNPGKFTITRVAKDLSLPLTVQFSLGGTALQGTDYRRVDGSAVIPAHELSVDIDIHPFDDSIDEADQTVICRLATDDSYAITAPGSATVTITDNDTSEFTIRAMPIGGGRLVEPTTAITQRGVFRVSRAQAGPAASVNITFTGTASRAGANADVTNLPTTVDFTATDTDITVQIDVTNDALQEDIETLIATLTAGAGYRLGRETSAFVGIMDGDQPTVDISLADQSSDFSPIAENSGTFQFYVGRSGATTNALSVPFTFSGTATVATDFTATASPLSIPVGSAGVFITVSLINDSVGEGTETIIATLGNSGAFGAGAASATAQIDDNDAIVPAASVQFGATTSTVNERTGAAATTHTIAVPITGTRAGAVTVDYQVTGGSANGLGVDYTLASGRLTYQIATTTRNITLTTTPDSFPEGNETVTVTLFNNLGVDIGVNDTHTITITDLAMPEAITDPVGNLPGITATLRGKAVANGVATGTNAYFEWGTSATSFPNATATQAIGTGHALVTLTDATISGLTYPGTYYYRTVASNAQGTSRGITRTIRTAAAPTGSTLASTIHDASSATLVGSVNPNRLNAVVWFEWGLTNAYGNVTPQQGVVASTVPVTVTAPITGLVEGTIYHYRFNATTSLGSVVGADMVVAAIPQVVAGELFVNLLAKNPSAGTATWTNQGTLGNFARSGVPSPAALDPNVANTAIPGVSFDDALAAYTGPAATADITGNDSRSIEVWAYNPGHGDSDELISLGRDGTHTATVLRDDGLGGTQHGADDLVGTVATSVAAWHHFVYTYDGALNATFYVDGVKKASKKLATNLATTLDPIALGYSFNSTGVAKALSFNGYINTVRIHGGLLSAANVLTNFNFGPATTAATTPLATTLGASAITASSATLNAQVVPRGAATMAWIEYGTSTAYDNASAHVSVGSGWAVAPVTLPITGLAAGVEYHFRVVSQNATNTSNGADVVFTPSATASTGIVWVDLRATDSSAGTATWHNRGALGDFAAVGSPTLSASAGSTGIPGVQFDGTSSAYESLANADADIAGKSDRTIETWVLNPVLDQSAESVAQLGRDDGAGTSSQLLQSAGTTSAWLLDSGTSLTWTNATLGAAPQAAAWHHLAIVATATALTTYVDGVQVNTLPQAAGLDTRSDPVLLGAARDASGALVFGSNGFSGFVNTMRLHGGALTAAQVLANYNLGPATAQPIIGAAPVVTTQPATLVTAASATLHGDVTPGGLTTTAWIEWGTTNALGLSTPVVTLANTFATQSISAPVGNLPGGSATHFFRIVAQNASGPAVAGGISTFSAAGTVAGLPLSSISAATNVLPGKATLNGVATTSGLASQAWFEYGPSASFGSSTAKTSITATTATKVMTSALTGLLPHATYSFRLMVENAAGKVASGVLTFNTPNTTPIATAGSAKLAEDTPTVLALKGSDGDKEAITYTITAMPSHGSLAFGSGVWTYTPAANYVGLDSFMFAATDGVATSPPVAFALTITAVNDAPVATAGSASGPEDTDIVGNVSATDPEGDAIVSYDVEDYPSHGELNLAGNGAYTYTPESNYVGSDSFTFTATNAAGTSTPALFTLSLTGTPDAPVASNSSAWTSLDTAANGQASASDPDGDSITFTKLTDPLPAHGTATLSPAGAWTFNPVTGYAGTASFTFKVNDGGTDSNIATITIVIGAAVANNATFTGVRDDLITGTLSATEPNSLPLTYQLDQPAENGDVSVLPDGTFYYNPNPDFIGIDSFTFQADNGTALSNPATITLIVTERPPDWAWIGGAKLPKKPGIYGTLGTSNELNTPGARTDAASWTDSDGTFWVFGGSGIATGTASGLLSDLWKNDSTGLWTWVGGTNTTNSPARYGAQGIASTANLPGARSGGVTWLGQDGKLYLFGGSGRNASAKDIGLLNDLWSYDPGTNEWTWLKGSQALNVNGNDGNQGTAPSTATPGARTGAAAWVDATGKLYLFGGSGRPVGSGTTTGALNDLWRYDPATKIWSWVRGPGGINTAGSYGLLGTPSGSAQPGARSFATTWTGIDGLLYLYGGGGLPATGTKAGNLNDLWAYNPIVGSWTWLRGTNTLAAPGIYGTLALPSPTSQPGARAGAVSWLDSKGDAWVFGGQGTGPMNDLWRYESGSNTWTWMKGASTPNAPSVYGIDGTSASNTTPGARRGGSTFIDGKGKLYLLGGANGTSTNNDLWVISTVHTPRIVELAHANLTGTSADLSIVLQPNEFETTYTISYQAITGGSTTDLDGPSPVSGSSLLPLTLSATGLTPGVTYIAQATATSEAGTGTSQRHIFTTPGAPPSATLAFSLASSTVSESAGVANVALTLNTPATTFFGVPYTLGGSATAGALADYTAPSGVIEFMPGQLSGLISIPIYSDTTDEPDETITLTLLAPVGSGAPGLGSPSLHTITLTDDDQAPGITTPPASQIVALGGSLSFNVVATGSNLTYQWKKNGATITGATGSTLTLSNVTLTSAAAYTVEVKNVLNTVLSAAGNLFVVDTTPKNLVLANNTASTTFTASAAGPAGTTFIYEWNKDASLLPDAPPHIVGAASKSVKITTVSTGDIGSYHCKLTVTGSPLLTLNTGTITLAVPSYVPQLVTTATLPTGVVGTPYTYQVLFTDNMPSDRAPQTFLANGLPPGLSINASTGLISGKVTTAVTKTVSITAKNPLGTSQPANSIIASLTILGLPDNDVGIYAAVIERSTATNNLGGRFDLTTTGLGAYTAKLTLGSFSGSATGQLVATNNGTAVTGVGATVSFARKNTLPLTVAFTLDVTTGMPTSNTLSATLTEPLTASTADIEGYRNPWSAGTPTTTLGYSGDYTFFLDIDLPHTGDSQTPQGNGFGAFTVAADG